VPTQLVYWYPAQAAPAPAPPLTQLDYAMLDAPGEPSEAKRKTVAEQETNLATTWRHVGIVPQTREQARAALGAPGIAVWDAPPAPGPFPVVVIGGARYLSTTAEYLASHGYLVVSGQLLADPWIERPPPAPGMSYEPHVRTQEWALAELASEPMADLGRVAALGHGGGGMQAMLLAMRQSVVGAVVSLDGATFSSRSDYGQVPLAGALSLRVPMLNLLRQQTLDDQDLYAEFRRLRYSERYEVIFRGSSLRHHDLRNFGRGISTVLKIRGPVQDMVLDRYAAMHRIVLAFLDHSIGGKPGSFPALELRDDRTQYALSALPAVKPAPSIGKLLDSVQKRGAKEAMSELRRAQPADPQAPIYDASSLLEVAGRLARSGLAAAVPELLGFAAELHPQSKEVAEALIQARAAVH